MTAEVTILNSISVAMAADSAVTVGKATKIYTSAEKLFQLTKHAPIGVMIYGNAKFLGIPWETIIKSYRRKYGEKHFDSVFDYAANLIKYIKEDREIFPVRLQDERLHYQILYNYYDVLDDIKDEFSREFEKNNDLTEKELSNIAEVVIDRFHSFVKTLKYLPGFNAKSKTEIRKKYSKTINEIKKGVFGKFPLSTKSKRQLTTLIIDMLCREYLSDFSSGVVVAGFGEKEYLPSQISFDLEEMIINKPRYREHKRDIVNQSNTATVTAFAQKDMVYAFMEGINQNLHQYMVDSTGNLFQGTCKAIIKIIKEENKEIGNKVDKILKKSVPPLMDNLFQKWSKQREQYWQPIVQIVSSLPKDELATMAENLVNLTKFKRRVTTDEETVGGPIDVAIITKGDGFVWIKRKHYFEPGYNPRLIAKYERGDQ